MKNPGERFDRYVIEATLGRGGMGEVYEALDTRLGRRVALKLILGDAGVDAVQRLLREARTAAAFEHPHAVVVYDVSDEGQPPFIAMELVRGKPLRSFVGDNGVPLARRLRWLVDVARALGAAHRAGLVHRDVKPDNVMIREDGHAKVLDFGIARRRATTIDPSAPTASMEPEAIATLTGKGVIVGTPRYSPPEQLRCEPIDGRADQFAWAVTAYELLSGKLPWRAEDAVGLLSQILSAEPAPLRDLAPDVPPEVDEAVRRALAKRPDDRFESIDALADVLESFAEAPGAAHGGGRERRSVTTPGTTRSTGAASTTAAPALTGQATDTPEVVARTLLAPTPTLSGPRKAARALFWSLAAFGGLIAAGLVVAGLAGKLHIDLPKDEAAPLLVTGLGCEDARIEGSDKDGDLARALGIGACARLAVDVGVDWNMPAPAPKVGVVARLGGADVEVSLSVADKRASGRGATPIDAVVAANTEMQKQLAAPSPTPEEIKSWGAKDAASARAIERVWRRIVLNVAPDDETLIRELTVSDPDSPWPWVLAALTKLTGTAAFDDAFPKALERMGKLPPSRAKGLRGLMLFARSPADRDEALGLLRQSYTEAPDDTDIAGMYAAVAVARGATEEGLAVVDRLSARAPTRSVVPLNNAVRPEEDHDLERDGKYVERLRVIFPESAAWQTAVRHLTLQGKFDEARQAVAFGVRLGMDRDSTGRYALEFARVSTELAALQPKTARELAAPMLAVPNSQVSSGAVEVTITSYALEGRMVDAESALLREIERQRTTLSPFLAAHYTTQLLRLRRYLGKPPADEALLEGLGEAIRKEAARFSPQTMAISRTELAVARARRAPRQAKQTAEAALAEIEQGAQAAAGGQRRELDGILVVTLPLVRMARGDAEAVKRWQATDRAAFRRRRLVALDAALALAAEHDERGAEAALRLGHDPILAQSEGAATLLSMMRLSDLLQAQGRAAEAAPLDSTLARLTEKADPGLRAAARALR
ncbi:MAG: serine/threonine-protein kinase [Polyangiaceae bacterium]